MDIHGMQTVSESPCQGKTRARSRNTVRNGYRTHYRGDAADVLISEKGIVEGSEGVRGLSQTYYQGKLYFLVRKYAGYIAGHPAAGSTENAA
jgi:hypothetical protein